jgi:hypothetical protein
MLADVAMNRRLDRRRALHEIERDLAASDQHLDALFFWFARQARGEKIPRTERISARPLRWAARLGRDAGRRRAVRTSAPRFR